MAGIFGLLGGALLLVRSGLHYLAYQKVIAVPPDRDLRLTIAHLVLTILLALMVCRFFVCRRACLPACLPVAVTHSLPLRLEQGLFVIGWYVAGSVWTFGLSPMDTRCDAGLYWFTFVIIVVGW